QDFPIKWVHGDAVLQPAIHIFATADAAYQVSDLSAINITEPTTVSVAGRVKLLHEPGFWYRIADSGPYANLYVQEDPVTAYLPGTYNELDFQPALAVTLPAASYVVASSNGKVLTAVSVLHLTGSTSFEVSQRVTVGGITTWKIASGSLA